jgi:hypothetical protein
MRIMETITGIKYWIKTKISATDFQVFGSIMLMAFYILLAVASRNPKLQAEYIWGFVGVPIGITELLVIWVHNTTITRWVRDLANKKTDTVVMIALIFGTWWLAGALAAGFFFCGFLGNHFGEKQT